MWHLTLGSVSVFGRQTSRTVLIMTSHLLDLRLLLQAWCDGWLACVSWTEIKPEFKLVESNQSSIQITCWRSVHYLLYSGDSRFLISPIPLPFPLNPQTVTADSSVSVKWSCVYVPLLVSTLLFWESWLWLAKHRGLHLDLFVLSNWLQSTLKIWNRWGILMWNCCTEPTDSLKSFKPCVHLCVLCCKLLFVWW